MAKDKDNTNEIKQSTQWIEDYVNFYTQKRHPVSKLLIDRLAEELVKWAKEDPNAFKLSQFYLDKGIPHSTFHKFLNTHDNLRAAYESARLIIGNRREVGAIKNNYNVNMVIKRQHAYDADWKKDEKWRNEMRKEALANADSQKEFKFVFEDFGEKKKKDHLPED